MLYVDVTFKLGPFFVLVTTYRNTTLFTKRSNPPTCPVMLGPVMLCMLKDKSTYLTLFQKLSAQVPGLQVSLKGYCTDSEEALRQALAQVFPSSVSLLCKVHAQRNIEDKSRKLRLLQSFTNDIINDIFGSGGLVFASSYEEYNSTLDVLTKKWDEQEFSESPDEPCISISGDIRQTKYGIMSAPKHQAMLGLETKCRQTTSRNLQTRLFNVGRTS